MKLTRRSAVTFRLIGILIIVWISMKSAADPIDLNRFDVLPAGAGGSVAVSTDGISATISENSEFLSVILSNDPGSGNPRIIVSGEGVTVQFDYDFSEGEGEDDLFEAFILDGNGNPAAGENKEFSVAETNSGTIIFDVSDLMNEPFIGLQFPIVLSLW